MISTASHGIEYPPSNSDCTDELEPTSRQLSFFSSCFCDTEAEEYEAAGKQVANSVPVRQLHLPSGDVAESRWNRTGLDLPRPGHRREGHSSRRRLRSRCRRGIRPFLLGSIVSLACAKVVQVSEREDED